MCDDGTLWAVDEEHDIRYMTRAGYTDSEFAGVAWQQISGKLKQINCGFHG